MKHILNNLSEEEKNAIREQHTGGMKVMTENFNKLINSKLTADCLTFGLLLLLPTKRALDYALFDHSHSNISLLVLESNLGYLFLMKRAHRPFTYLNKRQVPIVAFVEEIVTYLYGRDSEALIA